MSLIRVYTDVGKGKYVSLFARIVQQDGELYTIRFLCQVDGSVYKYEDDTYQIDDSSIIEYLDTDDETKVGFKVYEDGWIRADTDSDYEPSDEEEDEEEDDDEEDYEDEDEYCDESD